MNDSVEKRRAGSEHIPGYDEKYYAYQPESIAPESLAKVVLARREFGVVVLDQASVVTVEAARHSRSNIEQ